MPVTSFVVRRGRPTGPAVAVCARCAVRAECAAYALALLEDGEPLYGVWAGVIIGIRVTEARARLQALADASGDHEPIASVG